MDSAVRLTVLIVNWNVRELLRACLASLDREVRLPPTAWEVIVVDNDSADGSVEMLRRDFPRVRVIESGANLGFGAGCNLGYGQARGERVLLLNPDTEIVDHAVDELLAIMEGHPRAGIVAPRLVNPDRSFQPAAGGALPTLANVAWNYLFLKELLPAAWSPRPLFIDGDPRATIPLGWVSGASMLLRREAVGPTIFDEAFFMFGEDMDVCDRVRREGWDVLYAGTVSIVHHHGRSFAQQSAPEVRAAAHDGPRRVFARRRGRAAVLAYDAILFTGFLVRWVLFGLMDRLRPGRGYGTRARFSRLYVSSMWKAPAWRGRSPSRPG